MLTEDSVSARLLTINSIADAERELSNIKADPAGIAMMTPKMFSRSLLLKKLSCGQANIIKQEMLSLGGDAAVARGTVTCSIKNTDVILIGTMKQLRKLCRKLAGQPFGLPSLANKIETLLVNHAVAPKTWKLARRELSLSRPLIMGILNVTPDSFSDGSCFIEPQKALEHALEMVEQGADIIDIGGESSRPGAEPVTADEEMKRIIPVIGQLFGRLPCPVSVDTWKSSVAAEAVKAGAEIINDISGLTFDPEMALTVSKSGAGVVLMHTRGNPKEMQADTVYKDLIGEITTGLQQSVNLAVQAGIERERIVIDPGIGFGKDTSGNLEILRRLREFSGLGFPLLLGTSRKQFIGDILKKNVRDRIFGTACTVALAIANGAAILRVHDVAEMRDVADMAKSVFSD